MPIMNEHNTYKVVFSYEQEFCAVNQEDALFQASKLLEGCHIPFKLEVNKQ